MNLIIDWIVLSYLIGIVFFFLEVRAALINQNYKMMGFGIILLLLAPLTTWHGILHYCQLAFCRLTKRPVKYWL